MGLNRAPWLVLLCWVFLGMCLKAHSDTLQVSVQLFKAPHPLSNLNFAAFSFKVFLGSNGEICTNCTSNCTLDHGVPSNCDNGEASYMGLKDGNHNFDVCTNGPQGIGCANYSWTIDTVPPTAYITAATSYTNSFNVPVNISFSKPCTGGGGFRCSSTDTCNLLVYGAGQVVPTTLNIIEPGLEYSLTVSLYSSIQYGRVILVMDRNFCTDLAGNKFTRTEKSHLFVRFDRRSVFVNIRTHVPEQLIQLNGETRTVQATNNHENLKVYFYLSQPIFNSSAEILKSLHTSQGLFLPISGNSLGNRRFGFMVEDLSTVSIVTISLNSSLIISRQGTAVSPVAPVTFLFDSQRPSVRLTTISSTRKRASHNSVLIKFTKPVFGFNSSYLSISGGHLYSFQEVSRSIYVVQTKAYNYTVSISIPENVTEDVAGNKNMPSNILQVRHNFVPVVSVLSTIASVSFVVTAIVAGLLTLSTASLQSIGAFSVPSSSLTSDPARNLFRIACHIQVFALSRWLAVTLPIEYCEFVRGLQWSIPYFSLPWEKRQIHPFPVSSNSTTPHSYYSEIHRPESFKNVESQAANSYVAASIYGLPLTAMEYRSFFESHNIKPEAESLMEPHNSNGWRDFERNMFWLAVIGGSLILLHVLLLLILKLRKKNTENENSYGALLFPRIEIFLLILAIPAICQGSATLIKEGSSSGILVGTFLLSIVSFLLLALFLFLSVGITYGKLLHYKEIHQESRTFHWYRAIVRATLGPGKRAQWTWKTSPNSVYLPMFGPLFEDLRGPPKYMLSQISRGNPQKPPAGDRIMASDDETEDAEATCVQKLFGVLRIYYTFLESMKRFYLGFVAGAYSKNWASKTPIVVLLCIASFQLFFLVLKKPFIKKKVQLVEIISLSGEVGIFATCLVLSEKGFTIEGEMKVGIFMILLFFVAFLAQLSNGWYALYEQTKRLDPDGSFLLGLKMAAVGLLLLFLTRNTTKKLENRFVLNRRRESEPGNNGSTGMKRLRELARASFSKDRSGPGTDPSTSRSRWGGFWSCGEGGSRAGAPPVDFKLKPKDLYKDLKDMFASR